MGLFMVSCRILAVVLPSLGFQLNAPSSATLDSTVNCTRVIPGYANDEAPCPTEQTDDEGTESIFLERGPRLPGEMEPLGQSCEGCGTMLDLRCSHKASQRRAFYHRVRDCLVPLYGLLEKARHATGAARCAITWSDPQGHDILPFLKLLAGDVSLKLVDEKAPCANTTKYYSIRPTANIGPPKGYKEIFERDPMIVPVLCDVAANVAALHRDALRVVGRMSEPRVIYAQRKGTREMPKAAEELLVSLWEKSHSFATFTGKESVEDTLRMFVNAKGLIGYHGAGFVNALFTSYPACLMEISTYEDLQGNVEWRTNQGLAQWNPWLRWLTYHIPLSQMLEANNLSTADIPTANLAGWIMQFPYVGFYEADVLNTTLSLQTCIDNVEGLE